MITSLKINVASTDFLMSPKSTTYSVSSKTMGIVHFLAIPWSYNIMYRMLAVFSPGT